MKVLHINNADWGGGAAIAAYRHHEAMRRVGIDSKMLVLHKHIDDDNVVAHKIGRVSRFIAKAVTKLFIMRYHYFATWSLGLIGNSVHKDAVVQDADVIILHWVNGGMLSIKAIENILKLNKPVYWFMHDMWPITGGCHHAFECEKYKSHCERCPMANNMRGSRVKRDWSHIQFAYKMKHLSRHSNLHFITPSKWLADKVSESALFGRHDVHVCRNVLDTNIFTPCDKVEARKRLHLPLGKKLILFGADNLSSPYKGWPYLRDALSKPIDGAECVLYGNCDQDLQSQIAINVNSLGKISDTHKLVDLYSACDVFVTPSLADNYPNVIIEAMACGLPIVGFATGGIPEMIATGRDGIVVNAYDSTALRDAILSVLDEPTINYSQNAINRVNVTNSYAAEKTDLIRVITQ